MIKKFLKSKSGLESLLWTELAKMPGLLIAVTDTSFNLAWANNYFYEYFNCEADDVQWMPMHDFLGEDTSGDMSKEHISALLEKGYIWNHEARTVKPDGEFVTLNWNQRTFGQWILSVGFIPSEKPAADLPASPVKQSSTEHMLIPGFDRLPDIYSREISETDGDLTVSSIHHISQENIIMHYQPRVQVRTKSIIGVEALVRLSHPERGILYPATFLPLLEETGMILEVGAFVADAVCKKMRAWQDMGTVLSTSINVSPKQLGNDNFVQTLLSAAAKYFIEPGRLMLDISEQTIAANFTDAKNQIKTLKDAGFMVAVDDFNTSFLPMSAITQLPLDNITIDPQYITKAERDSNVYAITDSIIALAHGLNMTVTAGGVESRRQLDLLIDKSIDFLQGYLISKPLPENEFDRFLDNDPDFYMRHI